MAASADASKAVLLKHLTRFIKKQLLTTLTLEQEKKKNQEPQVSIYSSNRILQGFVWWNTYRFSVKSHQHRVSSERGSQIDPFRNGSALNYLKSF